jgi:hypothetical protein
LAVAALASRALPEPVSARARAVAAAAVVAAAPTIKGVARCAPASSARRASLPPVLLASAALAAVAQDALASPAAAGQGHTRWAWPCASRSRTRSGSSIGNLALTASVKRRMAWREALLQVLLISP